MQRDEKKKQLSLVNKQENVLLEFKGVNIKNYMLNTEIAKLLIIKKKKPGREGGKIQIYLDKIK